MLCSAKPIIFSEEFTAASLVKENKLGIVASNYSNEILKIYKNKKKYNEMAKKGARFVRDKLSWEGFGDRLIKAYEDALRK